MQRVGHCPRGIVLFALSCLGCSQPPSSEPARGLHEGVSTSDGGLTLSPRDATVGTLAIQPLRDGGGLTSRTPPKDAGAPVADAGTHEAGRAVEPDPTPAKPGCQTTFYRDLDGDGFGDANAAVTSCTQPPGHVLVADDCFDANERAHPGATGQFLTHRGDGSFDYDCDGVETMARTVRELPPAPRCLRARGARAARTTTSAPAGRAPRRAAGPTSGSCRA